MKTFSYFLFLALWATAMPCRADITLTPENPVIPSKAFYATVTGQGGTSYPGSGNTSGGWSYFVASYVDVTNTDADASDPTLCFGARQPTTPGDNISLYTHYNGHDFYLGGGVVTRASIQIIGKTRVTGTYPCITPEIAGRSTVRVRVMGYSKATTSSIPAIDSTGKAGNMFTFWLNSQPTYEFMVSGPASVTSCTVSNRALFWNFGGISPSALPQIGSKTPEKVKTVDVTCPTQTSVVASLTGVTGSDSGLFTSPSLTALGTGVRISLNGTALENGVSVTAGTAEAGIPYTLSVGASVERSGSLVPGSGNLVATLSLGYL